jgi:flagellar biosynthesis protein FlhA
VHIRDNLELKPNGYRILLKGVSVGQGDVMGGMFLAIDPGRVTGTLPGTPAKDPAFGLPAVWIDAGVRDQAQLQGYTVVDASTVVATHLSNLIHVHAAVLLGRQETQNLLDHYAKQAPKLVELVPKLVPLRALLRVFSAFWRKACRCEPAPFSRLAALPGRTRTGFTAAVRVALSGAISRVFGAARGRGRHWTDLERVLQQRLFTGGGGPGPARR